MCFVCLSGVGELHTLDWPGDPGQATMWYPECIQDMTAALNPSTVAYPYISIFSSECTIRRNAQNSLASLVDSN